MNRLLRVCGSKLNRSDLGKLLMMRRRGCGGSRRRRGVHASRVEKKETKSATRLLWDRTQNAADFATRQITLLSGFVVAEVLVPARSRAIVLL